MRRTAVTIVAMKDAIVGNLTDLFESCEQHDKWRKAEIETGLSGKQKINNPPYRIPAADTGTEIFFDNLELLSRYANMPLPDQETFCRTIREAFKSAGTDLMLLTIKWSDREEKVLKIKLVSEHLDIYLEEEEDQRLVQNISSAPNVLHAAWSHDRGEGEPRSDYDKKAWMYVQEKLEAYLRK